MKSSFWHRDEIERWVAAFINSSDVIWDRHIDCFFCGSPEEIDKTQWNTVLLEEYLYTKEYIYRMGYNVIPCIFYTLDDYHFSHSFFRRKTMPKKIPDYGTQKWRWTPPELVITKLQNGLEILQSQKNEGSSLRHISTIRSTVEGFSYYYLEREYVDEDVASYGRWIIAIENEFLPNCSSV